MKINLLSLLLATVHLFCQAQTEPKFNLDFEKKETEKKLSEGWFQWGDYTLSMDESNSQLGKLSAKIVSTGDGSSFGSIAYQIPAKYKGSQIQLQGYMKLEDVQDGFGGLLLRIDGKGGSLAFDNMEQRDIKGTVDWQQYTINLDYPEEAEQIFVAGILVGKGTAWFDNFTLTIDGKDVQLLQEEEIIRNKAQLDKEFDEGSQVKFPELTPELVANLELLGRIWGFMKYNHPAVNTGDYNWDYELFRVLPNYLNAKNNKQRDKILLEWIGKYGKIPTCYTCEPTSVDAVLKPNQTWMSDKKLSSKLRKQLQNIYTNRHQGEHFYIGMAPNIGNPKFYNERAYEKMTFPDEGFRLLAVYRYWNMIEYFFPYKHITDKKWDTVLAEYIPRFVNAKSEFEYEVAALHIIGDIKDTHANLWGGHDKINEKKGDYYPPFEVRFVENQLVVTKFYKEDIQKDIDVKIGDVITSINGIRVKDAVEQNQIHYPASNQPTRLRNISYDILRSTKETTNIKFTSDNQEKETTLKLYPRSNLRGWNKKSDEKCFKMLDGNIGYITLANIKQGDIPEIKEQFKDAKGIIIDIRNYPSAFVPFSLGGFFLAERSPFVAFTSANLDNPGEFTFGEDLTIPAAENTYKGKLVVIVNEESQSQAEYTAMAFRAGVNTTIVGSTTAGADGNVSRIMLPGGLRTMISGLGVYYPDGTETQRVGIVPDIEVKPTIEGIKNGKDELLEKAKEVITDN